MAQIGNMTFLVPYACKACGSVFVIGVYHINDTLLQISVDLPLIFRVSLGILWGALWAVFIQFNRHGKFLAEERTWITVVIGVGIDLLIAYPWGGGQGDWFTVALVISTSSIGIIVRSLANEKKEAELNPKSYKLIWGILDAIALTQDAIDQLTRLLETGTELGKAEAVKINKTLGILHRLKGTITNARRGDYDQKSSKGLTR